MILTAHNSQRGYRLRRSGLLLAGSLLLFSPAGPRMAAAGSDHIYCRVTIVESPDSDGDGLTDANEVWLGTATNKMDTDEDGLSDGKEVNNLGTDPLNPDTDGDGMRDGNEVLAGTDPMNAASVFCIESLDHGETGNLLRWGTVWGRGYMPLSSDFPGGTWTNLVPEPIYERDEFPIGTEQILDLRNMTNNVRFYRIMILPP